MARRSNKEIEAALKNRCANEYLILTAYKGRHEKILCKHLKCGYTWWVEAGAFLGNKNKKGSGCPYCYGNIVKTSKEFIKELKIVGNNEYELLSPYVNAKTKVLIKHKICGLSRWVNPNSFLTMGSGGSCPYCHGGHQLTTDQVKKKIHDISHGEYELCSKYINAKNPIEIVHVTCGTKLLTSIPVIDRKGNVPNCPICYPKSCGETLVIKALKSMNIKFMRQKRFSDLRRYSSGNLSYDFYLPTRKIAIEYQGIQHYKPVEFFGGYKNFIDQCNRDKFKAEYALKHNIKLICIPYTIDTLEKVEKFLKPLIK